MPIQLGFVSAAYAFPEPQVFGAMMANFERFRVTLRCELDSRGEKRRLHWDLSWYEARDSGGKLIRWLAVRALILDKEDLTGKPEFLGGVPLNQAAPIIASVRTLVPELPQSYEGSARDAAGQLLLQILNKNI